MVFQDRNWTARPWIIEDEQLRTSSEGFVIKVRARGTFDACEFTWEGALTGHADGRVDFRIEGHTTGDFWRNRLGLCILHPAQASGDPAIVEHADGAIEVTSFPDAISPHQPFTSMRALAHELPHGLQTTIRMTGEIFESEDHRNWSDASFKHYCTPISLPFPVLVRSTDTIRQSVHLAISKADEGVNLGRPKDSSSTDPVELVIDSSWHRLPELGIQLDADGHRLTGPEIELLRALCLSHVRIDLLAGDGPDRLEGALHDATAIGARLVGALVGAEPTTYAKFRDDPRIDHWLAFDPATKVTDPALVEQVRKVLGANVGGGTNLYFTELNRGRPSGPEIIAFSINPQVHAADDQSVMQNATTLGAIARNARMLYPKVRLEISPITLRPRFNPNATAPELDLSNTPLPSRVDARQCLPFGAAWTVLALKAIAESGCIDAVTAYQATGWEGLIERAEGSPQPADFPSHPGVPFPVYWVFRDLADARGVHPCTSTDPDRIDALVLDCGIVLVANLTANPTVAIVEGQHVRVPPHGVVRVLRPGT